MLKIVYFIDHLRFDGTQKILCHLAVGMAAKGYKQTIISINDSWEPRIIDQLKAANIDVKFVGKFGLLSSYGIIKYIFWLKNQKVDIAVTFLFMSDTVGRLIAKSAGIPKIVSSIRARNIHYKFWQRWLVRITTRWVDAIVLNSPQLRDFAIAEEGVLPEIISIIPNGIRCEDYMKPVNRLELMKDIGLSQDVYLIGSIGRLTYQKGFDLLIQAVKLLPSDKAHLLIIGKGNLERDLRVLVERLGLGKQVHFLGYRGNIPDILNCLDLYIQPSRFEGVPNALLEAMAAGRPVVACAVDGILDLVYHEEDGLLVPSNDVDALANAINQLLADPKKAKCYGIAAQNKIKEKYSIGCMIDAWNSLFLDLKSNSPLVPVE